jgi:hypothetical protein
MSLEENLNTLIWHPLFSVFMQACTDAPSVVKFEDLLLAFKVVMTDETEIGWENKNTMADDDFSGWHSETRTDINASLRQHFNQLLTELAKTVKDRFGTEEDNRDLALEKIFFMINRDYAQKNARSWPGLDSLPETAIMTNDRDFLELLLDCFEQDDVASYLKTRSENLINFASDVGSLECFTLLMDDPKTTPNMKNRQKCIRKIIAGPYNIPEDTMEKLKRLVDKPGIEEFLTIMVNRESTVWGPMTLSILVEAGGVMTPEAKESADIATRFIESLSGPEGLPRVSKKAKLCYAD